eukprot:XP_020397197.1 protein argonaute 2-like [Zea mays]
MAEARPEARTAGGRRAGGRWGAGGGGAQAAVRRGRGRRWGGAGGLPERGAGCGRGGGEAEGEAKGEGKEKEEENRPRGRLTQVAVGRVPEADPSIEAVVVPREAAGAAAASSPPGGLPVLAVEPPVTANVEMAKAPLLEVGDREPAPLAEEVSDALAAGGVGALEEGGAEPQPVLGSGDLILAR